jgi:N-acetylneuraminate synthase
MTESTFAIGNRPIGPTHPVYVVAELSANHGGDLDRARMLVRAAAAARADAVKLQTYTADTITIDDRSAPFQVRSGTIWDGSVLHDLYREAHTPWEWHAELAALAQTLGMQWFSTPFDPTAVEFLETLDVPAYKIASFEIVDLPLLRAVARTGKPVILSTGMATLDEIDEAVRTVREVSPAPLALLRASSAYPAPPDDMHLRGIQALAARYGVVSGLSDHSLGIAVPVAAVALGASIIEKHLTLSREVPGPDAAFSLEPDEFAAMVEAIRVTERAIGEARFGPVGLERASLPFRRSLFVVRDVAAGELLTSENVRSIRPAGGLHTRYLGSVIGQKAARPIPRGTPLRWDAIELRVRTAHEMDRSLLFEWANDRATRANSFAQHVIPWDEHCEWFAGILCDAQRAIFIVETARGDPIGQVRFECQGDAAEVSLTLAPEWRNRGLAATAIRLATDRVLSTSGRSTAHAYVKPDNEASRRAFIRAGYTDLGLTTYKGHAVVHLSNP